MHFRPRVQRPQVLHLIENVSYFPTLFIFMNNPSATSEAIPKIIKFIGFAESILAWEELQSTVHSTSYSEASDFHPNTVPGAKIIAAKIKATMIFI